MGSEPLLKDVLLVAVGSASAVLGTLAAALLQRSTAASQRVFERRLDALVEVWRALVPAQREFASRVGLGHAKWIAERFNSAMVALNHFRGVVEANQILLDASVVRALREIDVYLFVLPDQEDLAPSRFAADLKLLLQRLESAVEISMRRTTHHITLSAPAPRSGS